MRRQFDRQRQFECEGKKSTTMKDVLLPSHVVKRKWVEPQWRYAVNIGTLFSEVNAVPFVDAIEPEGQMLMAKPNGTLQEDFPAFCTRFIDAIYKFLHDEWKRDAFHLVFHDGDFGSRFISLLLVRLQKELGGRFGRVLFFTFGPMCGMVEEILKHEGWDTTQYVLLDKDEIWLHPPADIKSGEYFNGSHRAYPVCYQTLIAALDDLGYLPPVEHVQFISPFGMDYTIVGANAVIRNMLGHMVSVFYNSLWAIPLTGIPDVLYPMLSYDVIKVAVDTSEKHVFDRRDQIMATLDEKLSAMPIFDTRETATQGWSRLPDDVFEKVCEQYLASWYGTYVNPRGVDKFATKTTSDNPWTPWYSLWSSAAYCEYLIQSGYKLQVAG